MTFLGKWKSVQVKCRERTLSGENSPALNVYGQCLSDPLGGAKTVRMVDDLLIAVVVMNSQIVDFCSSHLDSSLPSPGQTGSTAPCQKPLHSFELDAPRQADGRLQFCHHAEIDIHEIHVDWIHNERSLLKCRSEKSKQN